MNKIQRMRTVLDGNIPDRIPASFWFHFPKNQAHGKDAVKAHLDYYHQVNPDFLKIMNEHHYRVSTPIRNPSDWRKLKPASLNSAFYQDQLDEIKMITDELGGECLTAITIFNPYASGNHASNKLVTEHLKSDPQAVHLGLETIAESLAEFALACLEAGADGIYFAAQGGEADRFEEQIFLEHIKQHDLTVLNAVKDQSDFNILHICGSKVRLHLYCNYPGNVINWAAADQNNIPLAAGKKLFHRPVLGGMDHRGVIVDGSPEEIRQNIFAIIKDFGTQGLILGADCTLPTDIDRENIHTAIQATALYAAQET